MKKMYVNLEPKLARKVEGLAKRLGLPKSRLVDILIRHELRREEREEGIFHILRRAAEELQKAG